MRAAMELRCFGYAWLLAAAATVAGGAIAGILSGLEGRSIAIAGALLGFSLALMLGALVLGRRTGPRMLYAQILDRSPAPAEEVAVEPTARTARRVVAPALVLTVVLLLLAPALMAALLTFVGVARRDLGGQLAAAVIPAAGWTLAAGVVALRMASYFESWERRRERWALCQPLRAGLMRYVYLAAPRAPSEPTR